MSRRAFFVLGAEGSGTNMLAKALVLAGCHEDPRHRVYMDDYEFEKMPDLLMFRRSLPHAGKWPDPGYNRAQMEKAGYEVVPLFIIRDWFCTVRSVIRRAFRHIGDIEDNMRKALYTVADAFPRCLTYVSYESFCLHPEFRRWLFVERLGLKESTIEINYANPKYYEEEPMK